MKMTSILFSLFLSVSALTQVNQHVITNANRQVVGPSQMRLVDAGMNNIPFKYRQIADAVGLMSMGCTGTHIGNGLVLSAGHCFDPKRVTTRNASCDGVQVFWGVREGKNPTSVSNCRQVLILELNNQKDYALFRVDNPPRVSVKVKLQGRPALGTRVTIFSHPFKSPLTWSGVCEITRALNYGLNVNAIHHRCDTNPGSSGAAIVDVTSMEVVGIHDGGVSQATTGANYGTYIDWTYIPAVLQRLGIK